MMENVGTRDGIVNSLTQTHGEDLEISCNLTSNKQVEVFLEEMGYSALGSQYIIKRTEMLKRLTCSWQGRLRDDLREIGKTPEFKDSRINTAGFEDH